MKLPFSKSRDNFGIFLCLLLGVGLLIHTPESPPDPVLKRHVSDHLNNEHDIAIVHLFETKSAIGGRQISALNRLHQRHKHIQVLGLTDQMSGCSWLQQNEARYPCHPISILEDYDFTQTSNVILVNSDHFSFLAGHQDYQQLIRLLELEF
jgi:hypothetical protein